MARPKTNTVEYFPMYSHSSRTCEMLESKYGIIGYAFFYKLLQLLATEDEHYYDARDPMSVDFLEQKLCAGQVSVTEILNTLSKWGKIDQELWEERVIWYQGFVNTLIPVYNKRNRPIPTKQDICSKLGLSVTETKVSGTETTHTPELPSQAATESTQSKVKESKVKEREREEEENKFSPPTLKQIKDYCRERKLEINCEKFLSNYTSNGWTRGSNKVTSWQATIDFWFETDKERKKDKKSTVVFDFGYYNNLLKKKRDSFLSDDEEKYIKAYENNQKSLIA